MENSSNEISQEAAMAWFLTFDKSRAQIDDGLYLAKHAAYQTAKEYELKARMVETEEIVCTSQMTASEAKAHYDQAAKDNNYWQDVSPEYERKAMQMKADSLALQSQAGGFVHTRIDPAQIAGVGGARHWVTSDNTKIIPPMPNGLIPLRELQEKAESQRIRQTNYQLTMALHKKEVDLGVSLQQCANLAQCVNDQQAEIAALKAERDKLMDDVASLAWELRGHENGCDHETGQSKAISRAISNANFGTSKIGLPLYDRY